MGADAEKDDRRKKYLRAAKNYAEDTAREKRTEAKKRAEGQLLDAQGKGKSLGHGYTAPDEKAAEWWRADEEPSEEEQFDEWLNEISRDHEDKPAAAKRWRGAY